MKRLTIATVASAALLVCAFFCADGADQLSKGKSLGAAQPAKSGKPLPKMQSMSMASKDVPPDENRASRKWTSSKGTTIEAKLLQTRGDQVTLAKEDGSKVTIAMAMLSKEDQEYIKGMLFGFARMEGLKLWLDASDESTLDIKGGGVAEWKDKSTNGFNAVQAADAQRPTFVKEAFGKMPMLHFEKGGQWLTTDCVPASGKDPRTLIVVAAHVKQVEWSLLCHVLHYGSPQNEKAYGITSRGWHSVNWGNHYWHGALNSGLPTDSGGGYIVVASFADGKDNFTVNGGQTYTQGDPWPQGQIDTAGTPGQVFGLVIGGRIQGGEGAWADIGEVMAFSRALSKDEREKIEGYLAHKWGMKDLLPANHPYKTRKP